MSKLNYIAIIPNKYAPCNTRHMLEKKTIKSSGKSFTIKKDDALIEITFFTEFGERKYVVNDIHESIGANEKVFFDFGHLFGSTLFASYDVFEPLFELGYNIFAENFEGFSLAHLIGVHKHYYVWLSKKYNISYDEINKEFEEYGHENPLCRISALVSRAISH